MPRLVYERIYWEDAPSTNTPLSAENLNHMENGLAALYADVKDIEDTLSTQIAKDLLPEEQYDEILEGYVATRDYSIGDLLILDKKNYRVLSAIATGDLIIPLPDDMTEADIPLSVWSDNVPNVIEVTLGEAVIKSVSMNIEDDRSLVRVSDIVDSLLSETSGSPLDAKQGNELANNIAYIESGTTASKDYSAGEFLILNSKLYKTTATILIDETLSYNVNITSAVLGDEIADINNAFTDLLWTGEAASGNIPLPERWKDYNFLAVKLSHYAFGTIMAYVEVPPGNMNVVFQMVGQANSTTIQVITMSGTLNVTTNVLALGTQRACNMTSSGNSIFTTTNMTITAIYGISAIRR